MPRRVTVNTAKVKEGILKAAVEKQRVIYKGALVKLSANFFAETLKVRREWYDVFKLLKGKHHQPRYSPQQGYHLE